MQIEVDTILLGLGSLLASIVIFYVKGIMQDLKRLPELIERVMELVKKVETLTVDTVRYDEKIKQLEDRVAKLEMKD